MTNFVYRKATIELPPIDTETLKKIHFSSKLDPHSFDDHEHTAFGPGTNVLADADRNDSARRAMRKDGGGLGL